MLRLFFSCLTYLFIFNSCNNNTYFEQNISIPNRTWKRNNVIHFSVPINDTHQVYNIFINIRNEGTYPYRNIYLFSTIEAPNGNKLIDTLNCILADEKGRWYGKSNLGDLYMNQFLYKSKVRFPHAGTYKFSFEQALRYEEIKHICDIGLRIETIQ